MCPTADSKRDLVLSPETCHAELERAMEMLTLAVDCFGKDLEHSDLVLVGEYRKGVRHAFAFLQTHEFKRRPLPEKATPPEEDHAAAVARRFRLLGFSETLIGIADRARWCQFDGLIDWMVSRGSTRH
jgi:hypothetical protein